MEHRQVLKNMIFQQMSLESPDVQRGDSHSPRQRPPSPDLPDNQLGLPPRPAPSTVATPSGRSADVAADNAKAGLGPADGGEDGGRGVEVEVEAELEGETLPATPTPQDVELAPAKKPAGRRGFKRPARAEPKHELEPPAEPEPAEDEPPAEPEPAAEAVKRPSAKSGKPATKHLFKSGSWEAGGRKHVGQDLA